LTLALAYVRVVYGFVLRKQKFFDAINFLKRVTQGE
jgi:hypothetical protein